MIPVPAYAKSAAREGLELRKRLKFGLSPKEAKRQGVASGVSRARQIVRNKTVPERDARKVARFYSRFKNCKTPKCEGALLLWGGRRWGQQLYQRFYRK